MTSKVTLPKGPGLAGFAGLLLGGQKFAQSMQRRYGDIMYFGRVPEIGRVVLVSHPDLVRELFVAPPTELDSTEGQRPIEMLYGPESLFLINGPEHRRLRRLMVPSFKGAALERFSETIAAVMQRQIERWPERGTVSVLDDAYDMGLEVILRIVMGINDELELQRWREPMHNLLALSTSNQTAIRVALRHLGGLSRWGKFNKTLDACNALVFAEIARRRADSSRAADADMLGMLMAARDEQGQGLSDSSIRDQLMTLLVAGHETTATTFSWTLERLVRHPAVLGRVLAEADAGESAYTEAAIKETLRLRPPVLVVPRKTVSHFSLGGYRLPPGTTIIPYLPLVHRNPLMFEEPEQFRPERFMAGSISTFGWLPFGGGLHACLGNHFAVMQVRVLLHTLLRSRELGFVHAADEKPRYKTVIQVPEHGCLIRVAPRRTPAPALSAAAPGCPFHQANVSS